MSTPAQLAAWVASLVAARDAERERSRRDGPTQAQLQARRTSCRAIASQGLAAEMARRRRDGMTPAQQRAQHARGLALAAWWAARRAEGQP